MRGDNGAPSCPSALAGADGHAPAPAATPPWTGRVAFWCLLIAVTVAPLPFGSRDPATVAAWCGWLAIGVAFAPVGGLRTPHRLAVGGVAAVVVGYAVVLHEQLAAPWLAPVHPAWAETAALLGVAVPPVGSAVRGQPLFALGAPLANVLVLVLAITVGTDRDDARRILRAVSWAGAACAAYGIASLVLAPGLLLWREKTFYVGNLTATFVNRNTAAVYLGACTVLWALMLMDGLRRRWPDGTDVWSAMCVALDATRRESRQVLLPAAMTALCLVATFLTASRAGTMLTLLALGLAVLMVFRRRLAGVRPLLLAAAGLAAAAVLLLQVIGGSVGSRFDAHGLADAGRLSAWCSTLAIVAAHPWTGTGLGTFTTVFPAYRSTGISLWGVWNAAHSTPLELAAELGLPLAGAVVFGFAAILVVLARGSVVRRRDRAIPIAGLCVALLAGLHTTIDFSLQVPGCSIVVFGVIGIGLAQSFRSAAGR